MVFTPQSMTLSGTCNATERINWTLVHTCTGPFAATDGSLSLWKGHMSTSFVLVEKPGSAVSSALLGPTAAPVGGQGPLSEDH